MSHEDHIKNQVKLSALNINFPVGCEVIIKGANSEPYRLGKRTGHTYITRANQLEPIITLEDGSEVIKMGAIMKHADPRLLKALDKLTGVEQWNVMANNYFISEEDYED